MAKVAGSKAERAASVEGRQSSPWVLRVLSCRLLALLRLVVADHAAYSGANQAVVMSQMARYTADDGALDAALGFGRNDRGRNGYG